ncbi:MAG: hypothetical protein K0S86_1204 [Geminicoccaceae bacterium]|jgi:hypothetical protein|nr:hypothetical protein [Geminicoccaceae bacterium]
MFLDERTVSRKTPLDGRLEISAPVADRLAALGDEFALVSAGRAGRGRVSHLACTCAKAGGAGHVHHFLESPILMSLAAGADVRVELDERASEVRVELVDQAR